MSMINGYDFKTIFSFFFKTGWRAKRTRLFIFFSLIPTLILLATKIIGLLRPVEFTAGEMFSKVVILLYFQLLIPLLALFYGTSIINDEVDNKTLIYLTTTPASKANIVLAKALAYLAMVVLMLGCGLVLAFVIAYANYLGNPMYIKHLLSFLLTMLLSILAYGSFFAFLGALMKKSVIAGIIFIFGWEHVVQYIPGTTQKLTIYHYVKSLLPIKLAKGNPLLMFQLQPSSFGEAVTTLVLLAALFLVITIFIFYKKEYVLTDNA